MRGKGLDIAHIFDLRALRVIVDDVSACYAALARVHDAYTPVPGEFDDYIAKPKPNGYQSLHTVVRGDDGVALEVQIRTRAMHEHAEHGVAAHWAYKEAGARGYAGVSAAGEFEERVAEARRSVLRQLLAWEREVAARDAPGADSGMFDDRIYVFTPQAAVIELPAGATPVDFAYSLHTDVGHRCRGARVDGAMVPLQTALRNGQTVEVITTKDGGPSRDWLNAELGFLKSPRARAKVRAWFNAQAQALTIARGRELVEKLLQREGRTALKLEHLAGQLGFGAADALFEAVGKDEYSLHQIENLLRPPLPAPTADEMVTLRRPRGHTETNKGGVLVVGVESLLTTLARCCRPAPPDAIGGFVTRGKGVAIHRADCSNLRHMVGRAPERLIAVDWGAQRVDAPAVYAVDLLVEADDRQGLLRDISELLAKEKMNVSGVHTQSVKDSSGSTAWMTFTVEVGDTTRLAQVLQQVGRVAGVGPPRRK
jgi:GTP pyrophosphokinase